MEPSPSAHLVGAKLQNIQIHHDKSTINALRFHFRLTDFHIDLQAVHVIFFLAGGASKLRMFLAFAVGSLLGDVFLHLLPEAWRKSKSELDLGFRQYLTC